MWVDGPTTWYRVTTWRSLAENVSSSVAKGDPVLVHGRLRSTPWEKDGRSGESLDIDAITVGPDLSRGRTVFHRVARTGGSPVPPSDADPFREDADVPADVSGVAAAGARGSGEDLDARSEPVGAAS